MQAETTQTELDLVTLEGAICEFLRREQAGTVSPWVARLNAGEKYQRLKTLGRKLGFRYAACTLENYQVYDPAQRPVLERLRAFAERMPEHLEQGGGLLLLGKPGTGKDHLLSALLKVAVAMHLFSVEWWDGGVLFDEVYYAIKSDSEDRLKKFLRELEAPHILAISDPQPPKGDLSDSQVRRIRDVIDRRYRRGVSTWITTNLDSRQNAEGLLTAPVLDRIREMSGQVYCDWPTYREKREATW